MNIGDRVVVINRQHSNYDKIGIITYYLSEYDCWEVSLDSNVINIDECELELVISINDYLNNILEYVKTLDNGYYWFRISQCYDWEVVMLSDTYKIGVKGIYRIGVQRPLVIERDFRIGYEIGDKVK